MYIKFNLLNISTKALLSLASLLVFFSSCTDQPIAESNIDGEEYKLVWSDEFNYEGLPDPSKWGYDVGDACDLPCGCGWGNQELQYYTKDRLENARVKDGKLSIELRKEKMETREYSSARLVSKGKGDWTYGRFEIRARIDRSLGTWAAIWMMPTNSEYGGWPNSGEIDIMENVGWGPDTIISTTHTKAYNHMIGTHKLGSLTVNDIHTAFHDYVLEWDPNEYRIYVDETLVFKYENEHQGFESWPFDKDFHLIMNIAYGGNLGGKEGIEPSALPCVMDVDYVRVYEKIKSVDALTLKK